jgi:hypothetical protein
MIGANTVLSDGHISLISALPATPIIDDPDVGDTGFGAMPGDVHASRGHTQEIRVLRRRARRALGEPLIPNRRTGILGIAAGRFNKDDGSRAGSIGWGWRFRHMFMVEDPTRRGRSAAADQVLVAHEVGHVLGLDHRGVAGAVMQGTISAANRDFNAPEVATMIFRGMGIRGSFIDPPGVFEPGPVIGQEVLDLFAGDENTDMIPEHLDLDSASTSFDRESNTVTFEQEVWGLIPEALTAPLNYWTLVDLDCNKQTGAPGAALSQYGLSTTFDGADLAMRATITSTGQQLSTAGQAWEFVGNQVFDVPQSAAMFSFVRDVSEGSYSEETPPGAIPDPPIELSDIIVAKLDNSALHAPFTLGSPFKMQMILEEAAANPTIWDRLDEQEQGLAFVFENPQYPNAYVVDLNGQPIAGEFTTGQSVSVIADGLVPEHPFELYVRDVLVAQGMSDANGDASAQFIVGPVLPPGTHALTFVSSGTAITASNVIAVMAGVIGDYNGDGRNGADDYVLWRKTVGSTTNLAADGNVDGVVDNLDYDLWRANFGSSLGPGSGSALPSADPLSAAVPEPSSLVFAAIVLAPFVVRTSRERLSTFGRRQTSRRG